jgi:hypothetical protein
VISREDDDDDDDDDDDNNNNNRVLIITIIYRHNYSLIQQLTGKVMTQKSLLDQLCSMKRLCSRVIFSLHNLRTFFP